LERAEAFDANFPKGLGPGAFPKGFRGPKNWRDPPKIGVGVFGGGLMAKCLAQSLNSFGGKLFGEREAPAFKRGLYRKRVDICVLWGGDFLL